MGLLVDSSCFLRYLCCHLDEDFEKGNRKQRDEEKARKRALKSSLLQDLRGQSGVSFIVCSFVCLTVLFLFLFCVFDWFYLCLIVLFFVCLIAYYYYYNRINDKMLARDW